ncbi:hypothetical protein H6P81_005271 [Aristolochia fimbriata]|uniref:Uncharacterized protein n=1 Tax=Aristolochia fimbriata TaxID=158543 RepID=A0AAV7EXI8_ARIFI|nr:hypothetical protein H6P81_005271 [Aristolochia fimbriata]
MERIHHGITGRQTRELCGLVKPIRDLDLMIHIECRCSSQNGKRIELLAEAIPVHVKRYLQVPTMHARLEKTPNSSPQSKSSHLHCQLNVPRRYCTHPHGFPP